MRSKQAAGIICFVLICGCASTNVISDPVVDAVYEPAFLEAMKDIDAIQIGELTLTDRQQILRFKAVCRQASWAPYVATMPSRIATIKFLSNGNETHRLLYAAGWLLDASGDGMPRFGTIHADDNQWVHENIDMKLMLQSGVL